MSQPVTVAGIGEILWDVLQDNEKLGGAPINFAYHVSALGGHGIPVSSVGDDERGRRALAVLASRGLPTECVSLSASFETGYVRVTLDDQGVPSYNFPPDVAWDHLLLNKRLLSLTRSFQGVCFGTLAQRSQASREAIHAFIDGLAPGALKVFDLNLRQDFYSREVIESSLSKTHILKLSDEELPVVAAMFSIAGSDEAVLKELIARHGLDLVALTRGPHGCLLVSSDETVARGGVPCTVADTIGAGDAFTAATALGRLLGSPLAEIADHANRLAAYVCTCQGAMPAIPNELRLL